jgi:hypothetical protein
MKKSSPGFTWVSRAGRSSPLRLPVLRGGAIDGGGAFDREGGETAGVAGVAAAIEDEGEEDDACRRANSLCGVE